MMLSTFHTLIDYVYIFSVSVCSSLLPTFNWFIQIFLVDLENFFILFKYRPFIFIFLLVPFGGQKILIVMKLNLTIVFFVFSTRNYCLLWCWEYITLCFLLEALWFLILMCKSWFISNDFLCVKSNISSIVMQHFFKRALFCHWNSLCIFQRLINLIDVHLFWNPLLWSIYLFICL